MFEQSILAHETAAHRTRALAASFGLQTVVIGAALLVPLLFSDHLPRVLPWAVVTAPLPAPPEPEPARASSSPQTSTSILHSKPRVFVSSKSAHAAAAIGATILSDAGPFADSTPGSVGVFGSLLSNALPPIVAVAPVAHAAAAAAKIPEQPRPVGGDVQAAKLIRKVVPQYPQIAKLARVSGTVRLTGVIAKDGSIEQLQVISGNPILVPAAIAAVKQWIYSPTFLNGQPVEVIAPIDVIFTLSQ
jgi:protein TonB